MLQLKIKRQVQHLRLHHQLEGAPEMLVEVMIEKINGNDQK